MVEAVIVDAVRTVAGRGKPGGQLSSFHPTRLLSQTLQGLVERVGIEPAMIDDVLTGCVGQAGEQALNIGRNAVLGAGFPESIPATTIDRQCGSSQQAVHFAAQAVIAGVQDVVIACGVESMSRVPMGTAAMGEDPMGPDVMSRYSPGLVSQGIGAELIAARFGLSRQELDEFACRSHALADQATQDGAFDREILPIPVDSYSTVRTDETIRPNTTVDGLAGLPPAFEDRELARRFPEIDWRITPGNSSPLTDGASAVLIMSRERADELGFAARARFRGFSVVGDDPVMMLTGPIPATEAVLRRAGLGVNEIDAFEVNEAFAPVPLLWGQKLGANPNRVNVRGGAIALGHPLGASGTKLLTTLLSILEDHEWRYGLQTMCEGGGMANAMIIERL